MQAQSKSRTAAVSPSPRPHGGVPLNPSLGLSPSPGMTSSNNAAKNILKNVESHVRLMSHVENVSVSSSYTALRLRLPNSSEGARGAVDGGDASSNLKSASASPLGKLGTSGASASTASDPSAWSAPYTVGRVHRGTSTATFYREVVAPCISNSCAGQSYLFLVTGPHESGRSQTLYGSPHHSEQGLVELTAADFIARMRMQKKLLIQAQEERDGGGGGQQKENDPPRSDATNNHASSNPSDGASGALVVTYAAFTTRGTLMADTTTGEAVRLEEFPTPLGTVPLPHMRLLEEHHDPATTVLIPEKKHADTSCIVQFHVYAPVGGSAAGRRSMATITFVDVAAFRAPLCREVAHVAETVRRVAGLSTEGDPNFKECKLTTLLEPALVGYVSLVSITTLSGRPDLYESACAAAQFASDIGRIHQVLMLTHIQSPRWLFDAGVGIDQLRQQRGQIMYGHYTRGVHDYYRRASAWLMKHVSDVDSGIEKLLDETEAIRTEVAREVATQARELEDRISEEDSACKQVADAARSAFEISTQQFEEIKQLDERIATLEQEVSHNDMYHNQRVTEIRIEIAAIEAKMNTVHQEVRQLDKEKQLYATKGEEVVSVLDRYAEKINYAVCAHAAAHEMDAIRRKRQRIETELELASQVAHRATDSLRSDRHRRSQLSRLASVQQRVETLRESVARGGASSTSPAAPHFGTRTRSTGHRASSPPTRESTLTAPTASSRQRAAATMARRRGRQSPVLDIVSD